jgi:hypothetical protein
MFRSLEINVTRSHATRNFLFIMGFDFKSKILY